jgi:pimeloyl-ACP methyl ester carboxylesterase
MNTQFLQVPEGKIAYDDTGRGPLVVCVPGMGDLRGEYRFLVPQLVEAGFRAVTLDVRGHGESSVDWKDYSVAGVGSDIVALVSHLNAGPAVIIGNSMAAGAAVWAAVEAPDWVSGLVLVGPAVHGEIRGLLRLLMGALFTRPWGPSAWLSYYRTLFPTQKPVDWPDYAAGLKRSLAQPGRMEALQHMMFASKAASESRLAQVSQPALILIGSRDPDFKDPASEAQWVASRVKGTDQVIEGAGHYPFAEMPELTGPRMVAFLKSLQPEVMREAASRS